MPLPIAVVAPIALRYGLRYGAVAVAAWTVARSTQRGARDQRAEDAMDRAPEGLSARSEADQRNGTMRFRRVLRWKDGRGIELDIAALGRIRIRRIGKDL